MKTEPKIEQWMRDAAEEICGTDTYAQRTLADIIAKHAPTNQPTTNIWRPVSVRPTREDGCELRGNIAIAELERDKARLDWLEADDYSSLKQKIDDAMAYWYSGAETYRAAIDAAMNHQTK